ncbi:flagellin [Gammaproteobacteria bacterium]|nr:flagellin [Gammaproteobacteria bacterium]
MTKINTNINAQLAASSIARNSREMEKSVAKLATGSRLNSSGSDPAGSTIAVSMSAKIQGAQMGMRNAIDAISMIHTIEASGQNVLDIMIRMRELGVQAASGTYSSSDRDSINVEVHSLAREWNNIASTFEWNGKSLMEGDDVISVYLGDVALDLNFGEWGITTWNYDTDLVPANAATLIDLMDITISNATAGLARYGAYMSALTSASQTASIYSSNLQQSRSHIADTNYADETVNLVKLQIILEASTAMLAQANTSHRTVLQLLD